MLISYKTMDVIWQIDNLAVNVIRTWLDCEHNVVFLYLLYITENCSARCEVLTVVYIHVTVHRNRFLFNNQPEALINQIYSIIKLYMFRASSLPIIRSFLLYIQHR